MTSGSESSTGPQSLDMRPSGLTNPNTEMSHVLVSIIIPVWNGRAELPACLESVTREVRAYQAAVTEIIVVDNGSGDGSADYVAAAFPNVYVLRNKTNLGFGGGCNTGLHQAKGEILILLNQDTEVQPQWLVNLTAPLLSDPTIGIAGSKALFPSGEIQHAGGFVDARGTGHHFGCGEPDRGQFDFLREVDFVTGASLAISRKAYATVGDLDEGYSPAYFEDVDLCWRVNQAGFRVVYVPDSVLIHKEQSTLLDQSHAAIFLAQRNRLRFVLKFWPVQKLIDEFIPAERQWLNSLGWQGERIAAATQRAYLDQLLHLASVVEARGRTLSSGESENGNTSTLAANDTEALAAILLSLRAIYPLTPANLDSDDVEALSSDRTPTTLLADHPTDGGGLGLMNAVRRRWPHLSLAKVTWPITRQLARLTNQQLMAEVLLEYVRENNREVADLAREIADLRRRLERLEAANKGDE